MARSASRCTIVLAVAVLLAGCMSSSGCVALSSAVLMMVPWAAGSMCAPMLNVRLAPAASVPKLHVTTFGAVWLHPDDAPANVVPAGSVSVTVARMGVEERMLVTVTVQVMSVPAAASAGPSLVSAR